MAPRLRGKKVALTRARRMVCDFLALSQKIPLANGERKLDLSRLRDAIAQCRPRPNLSLAFFKAYAIVAAERPSLRRLFVPRPYPHLYEHPENVGSMVIGRPVEGDDALMYLTITHPERRSLAELEEKVALARLGPMEEVPAFRRQLRLSRLPLPFRRLFYSTCFNWMGSVRARYLGTYGMSVLTSMGGATLTTWTPWTLMLHYTQFEPDGSLFVRFAFDHRVFDGYEVGMAIHELERALLGPVLDEIRSMPQKRSRAA